MNLNYQHLHYFWLAAVEGSITRASRRLQLAPSTVSTQIKLLEVELGRPLFVRQGRHLLLTDHGRMVKDYADGIFAMGDDLLAAVHSASASRQPTRVRVGIGNNVPKLLAYRLMSPALHLQDHPVHLTCIEGDADRLVAELAVHHLDLVIVDAPVPLAREVAAPTHLLGASTVTLFGAPALAARYRPGFPASLHGAPILLPDLGSAMREALDRWLAANDLMPVVVADIGDSALLAAFGREGAGLFPAPTLVAEQLLKQGDVEPVGELPEVQERLYAFVGPHRASSPAIDAIIEAAHRVLEA